jgi:hypothetical protein
MDNLLGQCNDRRLQGSDFDEPDDNGKLSPVTIDLQHDIELRKQLLLELTQLDEPHDSQINWRNFRSKIHIAPWTCRMFWGRMPPIFCDGIVLVSELNACASNSLAM